MNAFDDLERGLRAAVRREHRRVRRPWPPLLACGAALLVAGGALAATGTIRIGPVHDDMDPRLRPSPHHGVGVRASPAKTLALRVADPAGGPPWTLRAFDTTRAANCVQVGQVVRGRFGVFVPPATLEPLRAWPGGMSSLCSGQSRDGFPVVRGLSRLRIVGGVSDARRCGGQACPITRVTLLRYGFLGPGARSVRLVDARGRTLGSMQTNPRIGGAYLFAQSQPIAPYVAAEAAMGSLSDDYRRARRAATARGLRGEQATRAAVRAIGQPRPTTFVPPPEVGVVATFADGRAVRVAGRGRSHAPLPGVAAAPGVSRTALPHDVPIGVRVLPPGRWASIVLSFRAPRAITRFDVRYTSTLHGRTGVRCDDDDGGGFQATTGDVAAGQTVRLTMRRRGPREGGRTAWCPGRFTGEVRYSGPGRDVVIGRYAFTIP